MLNSVCTVFPIVAIMIKTRSTITAYSIPDLCKRPQADRGEDEGDV